MYHVVALMPFSRVQCYHLLRGRAAAGLYKEQLALSDSTGLAVVMDSVSLISKFPGQVQKENNPNGKYCLFLVSAFSVTIETVLSGKFLKAGGKPTYN